VVPPSACGLEIAAWAPPAASTKTTGVYASTVAGTYLPYLTALALAVALATVLARRRR